MYLEKQILLDEKQKRKINKKKVNKSEQIKKRNLRLLKTKKKQIPSLNKKLVIITTLLIVSFLLIFNKYKRTQKHNIPIAFSLNSKYCYPLIVSLTSILFNAAPSTFYTFYLLLSPDLEEFQTQKILSLKKKYPNCKFKLIHMGQKYSEYNSDFYGSASVF